MTTEQEIGSAIKLIKVVADTVKVAGQIPSGHLYAAMMHKIDLSTYNRVIDLVKRSGLVEEKSHLLKWIG